MYVRLKHLHRHKRKLANGEVKTYTYIRGTRYPLPGKEGSPEFMAAYYETVAGLTKKKADDKTMQTLIAHYKASSDYSSRGEKTRRDYARYIKLIEDEFGTMPRAALESSASPSTMACSGPIPVAAAAGFTRATAPTRSGPKGISHGCSRSAANRSGGL